MRVVASLTALFVFSGIHAVAQYSRPSTTTLPQTAGVTCLQDLEPATGKSGNGNTGTTCTPVVLVGCPVDMQVHQRMGGGTVAVDENGIKRKVFAQRLRLILNGLRHDDAGRKAVSATVTVYGTGTKARLQSLSSESTGNSMMRTFSVDLAHWGEPGVSGEFMLPGFTSASRVDLESVTYDDGTTWKLSKNESCRVAPDPLMLVNR